MDLVVLKLAAVAFGAFAACAAYPTPPTAAMSAPTLAARTNLRISLSSGVRRPHARRAARTSLAVSTNMRAAADEPG
jgi:hypothetical protein